MSFSWHVDIGNVLTLMGLLIVLWRLQNKKHVENQRILHELQKRTADISKKMTYVWGWFKREHGFNGEMEDDDNG